MTTLAPAACRRRAAASPRPEAPPVTIAPTPLSSMRCAYRNVGPEEKFGGVQFADSWRTGNAGRSRLDSRGKPMTATESLRYIDSDGHILEHPTGDARLRARRVPRPHLAHRDRRRRRGVARSTTATSCRRTACRSPAPPGFSDEDGRPGPQRRDALHRGASGGVQRQGAPAGHGPGRHRPRGAVPDDRCSGCRAIADVEFAEAQARAYNDWCSDHTQEGEGRLFGAGAVPPMHDPDDVQASPTRSAASPSCRAWCRCSCGPNPAVDWRPFNDPVYDPIWQAAADTGLPIAFHPFLAPDLPGRVRRSEAGAGPHRRRELRRRLDDRGRPSGGVATDARNILFTQAIANPVDVMSCDLLPHRRRRVRAVPRRQVHLPRGQRRLAGAVARAARPPLPRSSSGTCRDLTMLPSEYFRRQCWISFDPDESMLAFTAKSPLVRRRPHHLGVGLPAPRRQVPRRHRGARPRRSRA